MIAAHQRVLDAATTRPEPFVVPISEIASTGHPLNKYDDVEKVRRMRKQLRAGEDLPPVRLEKLTPELRDKYGVADPDKSWYMTNGHHRLAARKLEGETNTTAVETQTCKRL